MGKDIKYHNINDIPEHKIKEFVLMYLMYGYAFLDGKSLQMTDECYEHFYEYVKNIIPNNIRKE